MYTGGQYNETAVAAAFGKQATKFDDYDAGNAINQYKRNRVREHVLRYLPPTGSILELNAGTGIDAVWFAQRGYRVHATDVSIGMQDKLREKVLASGLSGLITAEVCSFTDLENLRHRGPYDLIFSNFAGLNCSGDLGKVLASFSPLLRPGGQVSLTILSTFCLWEALMMFRGKFKTAFRRLLSGRNGTRCRVEGQHFRCWYYSPASVIRGLGTGFEVLGVEGLCTLVPPSYIEGFAGKHPAMYRSLRVLENKRKAKWPWRNMGDYFIISLRKM
ncbi:MAG TPA: methyltransferase domain-containing protein [Puia sp.]|nr:methyltransferase domain-containing protein [Puia sp.]